MKAIEKGNMRMIIFETPLYNGRPRIYNQEQVKSKKVYKYQGIGERMALGLPS